MIKIATILLALLIGSGMAEARTIHGSSVVPPPALTGGGELVLTGNFAADQTFLNQMKTANAWNYNDNSGVLKPDELTTNGYPKTGGFWFTSGKFAKTLITVLSQYEHQGNIVFDGTGTALIIIAGSNGAIASVSCVGAVSIFGNGVKCDNTGCSTFTGSISLTTLTVTAAPTGTGCTLGPGVPISTAASTLTSKFGTKTYVTSTGSVCGSNTCYTVNQSQTVASTTMTLGYHLEFSVTTPQTTTNFDNYVLQLQATGSGAAALDHTAFFYKSDESAMWASAAPSGLGQGNLAGTLFKTRVITQGGFTRLRDLDWVYSNVSLCSTWATRRTLNYFSYAAGEPRNAASGPGQYVNAAGTGATGGTVSYNAGTDIYSVTLGSGGPVDKQTFLMLPPSTGTGSSKINLNGTGAIPIGSPSGSVPSFNAPTANLVGLMVYDQAINAWLYDGNTNGFGCAVPPEVFIEVNAEFGTQPWHVVPYMAMDPMTDWMTQFATYIKANYPTIKPLVEISNEPFNCNTAAPNYLSVKSTLWITADPTHWQQGAHFCGPNGNNMAEIGKMASTVGQDLDVVYGTGNYELAIPVQTYTGNPFFDSSPDAFSSVAYVNQTITVQSGYAKTPAWNYSTRISINDYWNVGYYTLPQEVSRAWCYYAYGISPGCQSSFASQAAVMTDYMASSTPATCGALPCNFANIFGFNAAVAKWNNFATTCGTGTTRPGSCVLNLTTPLAFYEGGFNMGTPANDYIGGLGTGTAAASAVFLMPNSGCADGQSVTITGMTGGWTGAGGNYTVQATGTDATHCALNLNSTGFAAMFSTTATAAYSTNNTTISVTACPGSIVGAPFSVYNVTKGIYSGPGASCSGGVITMAGPPAGNAFVVNGTGSIGDTIVFAPTITFNGSKNYIAWLQGMSYTAPELDTLTTQIFTDIAANGGSAPSQYLLSNGTGFAGLGGFFPWFIFGGNVVGNYAAGASCTACNVAGTTLTLGGTITGVFQVGQLLLGGQITGLGTGAGSNTTVTGCTKIGSGPCGTNSGDTLTLSQSGGTLTGVSLTGSIPAPPNFNSTGTTSPVRAWGAFCRLAGNGNQCNGWLLKRDLDPASNDNDPMWLEKAA